MAIHFATLNVVLSTGFGPPMWTKHFDILDVAKQNQAIQASECRFVARCWLFAKSAIGTDGTNTVFERIGIKHRKFH